MPRTKRVDKQPPKVVVHAEEKGRTLKKDKEFVRFQAILQEWSMAEETLLNARNDMLAEIHRNYDMLKCKIPDSVGNQPPRDPVRHSQTPLDLPVVKVTPAKVTQAERTTRSSCLRATEQKRMPPPSTLSRYRTPNCNLASGGLRYNAITPKILPNTSLAIVRRPREGEMAFAMTGSPLLVSSAGSTDAPNVIVPLMDGRVMSILPQVGLRSSDMPEVDSETMQQLRQLRDNLEMFCVKYE